MRSFKRMAFAAFATTGLVAGLTACSSDDEQAGGTTTPDAEGTTTAASEASEDTLVLYSGRSEDLVGDLIAKFQEETGINVDVQYGKTAEIAQQLLTEGDRTPAQVFLSQEAGALGLVANEDMLITLPDEVLDEVPSEFNSDEGQWVGLTGRARVVAYDKDAVEESEVPETVEEMVDPKWKGKLAIAPGNASFLSFVTAMRVVEGDDATREWLEKLKENDVQIYEKNGDILEAVNNGEVEMGLINHYYWYKQAAEEGADNMRAQLKYGEPGNLAALINVTGAGILKGNEDNAAALEFVKFLLSEQGQQYFAENTYEYPLVKGQKQPEGVPALDVNANPKFDLSDLDSVDETASMIDEVGLN